MKAVATRELSRCKTREFAKIGDQVRLIRIAVSGRKTRPAIHGSRSSDFAKAGAKASEPRIELRADANVLQKAPGEMLAGDAGEIGHSLDGDASSSVAHVRGQIGDACGAVAQPCRCQTSREKLLD